MSAERRVKCRWCEWSRPVVWTNSKGKTRHGLNSLWHHVTDEHWNEYVAIDKRLTEEENARKPITRESWV